MGGFLPRHDLWIFPGGSEGKVSACNAGDWVQSLGREDLLEKEMATHSSILASEIPWAEEPVKSLYIGLGLCSVHVAQEFC